MLKIGLNVFIGHFVTMDALLSGVSVKKHRHLYPRSYDLVQLQKVLGTENHFYSMHYTQSNLGGFLHCNTKMSLQFL